MYSLQCRLVGLRYHAWRGDLLQERMAAAVGKEVVLMRDPQNFCNPDATVACIDAELIGYVRNDECRCTTAVCDLSDAGLLHGEVTSVDYEECSLTAQFHVDSMPDVQPLPVDSSILEWEERHRQMPIMELSDKDRQLLLLQRLLEQQLTCGEPCTDGLRRNVEAYLRLVPFALSREAGEGRRRLCKLMSRSPDGEARECGKRLDILITQMGGDAHCQRLVNHLLTVVMRGDSFRRLMALHGDVSRQDLERWLMDFPHDVYREWRADRSAFISRIYYLQVPETILRRLLSGVLMLEALTHEGNTSADGLSVAEEVMDYVERIAPMGTERWRAHLTLLWTRITRHYGETLVLLNGQKGTIFNRRFVLGIVGMLISRGVYRRNVSQTDYIELLEGNRKSNRRQYINQGVMNDDVKMFVKSELQKILPDA